MSEPTPIRPAAAPVEAPGRSYRVLRQDAAGLWHDASLTVAESPEAAIEKVVGDGDPGEHQWVAIASRYWSPQSFQVEVKRSLVPKAVA